ncbi:SusC/RagA family TonB-linked outer membrane protein [Chitinophaga japonensis]|uniref:TonB-linked SusC/RagA family outer membrane protein n=1 Tax=Chitinophaga japonensis TaxID=104662 RepID=A0A562TBV2_CHIJA|nr:TonB-dependent receptor [Chitinophaga japonensis]TWI90985.1 TonB-linked SusC/RagA family outer membrane protein [Chitinophaga japonensis]
MQNFTPDLCRKQRHACRPLWLCMQLLLVLFTVALPALNNTCSAQGLTMKKQRATLEEVFSEIRKQTGYNVLCDGTIVQTPVSNLQFSNTPLAAVLDQCFAGLPLSYTISKQTVVVKKTAAPVPAPATAPVVVTGTVTDRNGQPLPGVTIKVKDAAAGTTTDAAGKYSIRLAAGKGTLVFNYIGFAPQEIAVSAAGTVNVTLLEQSADLDAVVVVGYGTQKRGNVTGSIATVTSKDITKAPVASTANTLAGRLPGLISLQSSGRPGADAARLSIRGFGDALVIVDGIESDFRFLDPNQIESISILKDAAAAIYGARAGNGVILVTTKRGTAGKPVFTVNTSRTWQGITVMPTPVNAGQYAELAREKHLNEGKPEATAPFTEEQVQKYYAGTDPLFPDTDWYDELIRSWAPQQQHNIAIRGGSDAIKYYGFLGYLDQETVFKNNGGHYKRYNFQSNIDAKILDNLSLELTMASIIEDRNFPQVSLESGESSAWGYFWNTLPVYPARLPDPSKIPFADGNGTGGAHVVSNSELSGYNNTDGLSLRGSLALNYRFKFIDGLSARAFLNYAGDYVSNRVFVKPVTLYTYDPASQVYTVAGAYGSKASLSTRDDKSRVLTVQYSLKYDKTFAQDHHITALALYEAIDYSGDWISAARKDYLTPAIDQLYAGSTVGASNNGSATEMGRMSYVGRLNYAYRDKYLLEGILRADASARFPANSRWGYFPGVSLGWRATEEPFLKGVGFMDNLKLRASYGAAGNDGIGNFQYLSGYQLSQWPYILGQGPQQGLASKGLPNPYMTWEKISTYNAGLEFSLFRSRLYGELDVFYRQRAGILANRATTVPSSFGATLPPENLNSLNDRGFELSLGTTGRSGDLSWDLSGNVSWSRAKWDHYEEPDYTDPDQARINGRSGKWVDRQFGYLADGIFTSQEEINKLPFDQDQKGNTTLRPGDLRLRDVNGDQVIDWKDQVEIGQGTTPHWMMGLSADLRYRDFDFSALFQGAMGHYTYITFVQGKTYPTYVYENRWTPEHNDPNALVPRIGGAGTNNYYTDARYKRAGYMRLKMASLGYSLPKTLLDRIKVSRIRLYIAATNILTFNKLRQYDIDPEAPTSESGRYYPQQKTVSVGANISF